MPEATIAGEPLGTAPASDVATRRWWILGVVGLTQLMLVVDATITIIALPQAQEALEFADADRVWVVSAYSLCFGGLLLLGGRMSDLFGRRRMFLVGLVGFAIGSALGGAASSFGMLVLARAVQGASGAMLAPAALSVLTTTFVDPPARGKAFGIYGAISGTGAAVGLLLGGVLTESLSWRACLYVGVVVSVVALAGALRLLVDQPRDSDVRLDLPGTALVVSGLVAIVFGFSEAARVGWGAPLTVVPLVAGALLLVAFVVVERRVDHPLLPLRIVLDRFRGGSYLAICLTAIGIYGAFLFITYYLQLTSGYSPSETGLAMLPMVVALIVASTFSSTRLLPRIGPRRLIPIGTLLAAGGAAWLTRLEVHDDYLGVLLPGLLVLGVGIGVVFGCAVNVATYGADPADAGVASAMVNTSQQLGASIGIAFLNTIAASATASTLATHGHDPRVLAEEAVQGDAVAFAAAAGIFVVATIVTALVLPSGVPSRVSRRARSSGG